MRARLQDVRRRVAIVRRALLSPSPEEIRLQLPELMESVRCLSVLQEDLQSTGSSTQDREDLVRELQALNSDLRMAERMIDHSLAYYAGWAKLLGSAAGGYVSSGESAPLTAPAAVWVQG